MTYACFLALPLFNDASMNYLQRVLDHNLCFSTSRCKPEGQKIVVQENMFVGNKIRSIENITVKHGDKRKVCVWRKAVQ